MENSKKRDEVSGIQNTSHAVSRAQEPSPRMTRWGARLGVDAADSTPVRQSIATTHSAPYRHLKTKTANQSAGKKLVTTLMQIRKDIPANPQRYPKHGIIAAVKFAGLPLVRSLKNGTGGTSGLQRTA